MPDASDEDRLMQEQADRVHRLIEDMMAILDEAETPQEFWDGCGVLEDTLVRRFTEDLQEDEDAVRSLVEILVTAVGRLQQMNVLRENHMLDHHADEAPKPHKPDGNDGLIFGQDLLR